MSRSQRDKGAVVPADVYDRLRESISEYAWGTWSCDTRTKVHRMIDREIQRFADKVVEANRE